MKFKRTSTRHEHVFYFWVLTALNCPYWSKKPYWSLLCIVPLQRCVKLFRWKILGWPLSMRSFYSQNFFLMMFSLDWSVPRTDVFHFTRRNKTISGNLMKSKKNFSGVKNNLTISIFEIIFIGLGLESIFLAKTSLAKIKWNRNFSFRYAFRKIQN